MEQEYNSSYYYYYHNHPNTTATTPPPSFDHPNVLIDSHDYPIRPYSSFSSTPVLPAAVANLHAGNYTEKKKKGMRGNDNGHSSSCSSSVNNKKGKVGGEGGAGVKLSTDPQSIAARERRHRISNRFKILQSLVPGGAKLDTVSMLEQAIQYVKYLKTQIWIHQTIINNNNNNNTTDHLFPHTHDHDHQNSFSSHDWPPYAAAVGGGGDQNGCGGDSGGDCYGMYQQGSLFLPADDHGDAMMMPSLPPEIAQASLFGCDDNMYSDGTSVNYYS